MIKRIAKLMDKKPNKSKTDFFKLSSGEQKDIIKKAIRISNKEQYNLIKEYEKKFNH